MSVLASCGGGSGGGSGGSPGSGGGSGGGSTPSIDSQIQTRLNNISDESLASFQSLGELITDSSYTGSNSEASVSESSFAAYNEFLLAQEEGAFASSGAAQAKPSQAGNVDSALQVLSKIDVNGTENCESGSLTLTGEVEDNGVGAVHTSYDECTLEGVTFNGEGALYIQNEEFTSFYLLYRNLEIRVGSEVETLNGIMWFDENEVVFDLTGRSSDGTHYRVKDWAYRITDSGFGLEFVSGRVYLAESGYLTIEKNNSPVSYRFAGAGNAVGYLLDKDEYWILAIDSDQDNSPDYFGSLLKSESENDGWQSVVLSPAQDFIVPEYMSIDDSIIQIETGDGGYVSVDLQAILVYDRTIPTNLSLNAGDSTISLSWNSVAGASVYRAYYAEESFGGTLSGYLNLEGGGSVPVSEPEATFVGLNNGQVYYYVITSIIDGEESELSEEMSAVPEALNTLASVLYGPIDELDESTTVHTWGLNGNFLCTSWSVGAFNSSGYMAADDGITRASDLYVLPGPSNPLEVSNAENFEYDTLDSWITFDEGDTVFFRGGNNYYGAWHVTDIAGGSESPTLTGTWYFVTTEGSGDFTGSLELSAGSFQTSSFSNCPQLETP
jgi:hypothetical protein